MDRVSKAERELVRKIQKQTNADRIRAMTDEELAEFVNDLLYGLNENPGMCDVCDRGSIQNCKQCWLEWLRQEVEM